MNDHKSQGIRNRDWGKEAENIAADYLRVNGYTVRERNWRVGNHIEIDIIAEKDGYIIFVEVKARTGNFQHPLDAIDSAKQRKIIKGGDIYLRQQSALYKYRLDIITVTGNREEYSIEHIPDAFLPPLSSR